jgi:P-type E1-E2 ATPase
MWNSEGAMVGWIGVDKIAVGIYSVGDQLRLEAVEAVKDLQKLGIRVAMLTGDSSATAEHAHKKVKLCFLICLTDFVKFYHTYLMEIETSFWQ